MYSVNLPMYFDQFPPLEIASWWNYTERLTRTCDGRDAILDPYGRHIIIQYKSTIWQIRAANCLLSINSIYSCYMAHISSLKFLSLHEWVITSVFHWNVFKYCVIECWLFKNKQRTVNRIAVVLLSHGHSPEARAGGQSICCEMLCLCLVVWLNVSVNVIYEASTIIFGGSYAWKESFERTLDK